MIPLSWTQYDSRPGWNGLISVVLLCTLTHLWGGLWLLFTCSSVLLVKILADPPSSSSGYSGKEPLASLHRKTQSLDVVTHMYVFMYVKSWIITHMHQMFGSSFVWCNDSLALDEPLSDLILHRLLHVWTLGLSQDLRDGDQSFLVILLVLLLLVSPHGFLLLNEVHSRARPSQTRLHGLQPAERGPEKIQAHHTATSTGDGYYNYNTKTGTEHHLCTNNISAFLQICFSLS